jgi:hypothetical protein
MTADRTVTHLEGTDFQKSRAFSLIIHRPTAAAAKRRAIASTSANE